MLSGSLSPASPLCCIMKVGAGPLVERGTGREKDSKEEEGGPGGFRQRCTPMQAGDKMLAALLPSGLPHVLSCRPAFMRPNPHRSASLAPTHPVTPILSRMCLPADQGDHS